MNKENPMSERLFKLQMTLLINNLAYIRDNYTKNIEESYRQLNVVQKVLPTLISYIWYTSNKVNK